MDKPKNPTIAWTFPPVPSYSVMFMLEAFTFKVAVEFEHDDGGVTPPESLMVQAWTNVYHSRNPQGDWHHIDLQFIEKTDNKYIFGDSVILTSHGNYSFTYRLCYESASRTDWVWVGHFQQDGIIEIRPPSNDCWTQGPDFTHIAGNIYLGNFIAATKADELGFSAVLNVADNLDLIPEKFGRPVLYKKIPMADGAHNPIPPHLIEEAVGWLCEQDNLCGKVLVNCRAGIGRAGSTVIAYVFAKRKDMDFEAAYNFVFEKRFVYPHRDLKDIVFKLFRC